MSSQLSLPAVCLFKDAASIAQQLNAAFLVERQSSQNHHFRFEVDCSNVTAMDSSLLAVLLDLKRRAQAGQQTLAVLNPPVNLRRLAKLYGLDTLLLDGEADTSL